MSCKYCQSPNLIRFGIRKGVQYYWCKSCKRKFVPDTLPKMKTPTKIVASALGSYFGGMPLDAVQRQIQQDYGLSMSEVGIYKWVTRFSEQAVKQARTFKPKVGDVWLADETVIKVGGRNIWFWDMIDRNSRFLLASRLSFTRTIKDAALLMKDAVDRAGKMPKAIITDKLAAYVDGIELVCGANTKHIQSKPFTDENSTNIIERFHGTLKERTDVVRGFKNLPMARLLTEAWLVHYNFFKEHTTLGDIPPAQKMGVPVPFHDWREVLEPPLAVPATRPISFGRLKATKPQPQRTRVRRQRPLTPSLARIRTK